MSELFKELTNDLSKSHKTLERFTLIEDMPTCEPWDAIKKFYKSKTSFHKILATVLNGIATEGKDEFLLSQPMLNKMFKADPNDSSRTAVSGDECGVFMARAKKDGLLETIVPPTSVGKGDKENLAGLYRLKHPAVRKSLGMTSITSSIDTSMPVTMEASTDTDIEIDNEHEFENECDTDTSSYIKPVNNKTDRRIVFKKREVPSSSQPEVSKDSGFETTAQVSDRLLTQTPEIEPVPMDNPLIDDLVPLLLKYTAGHDEAIEGAKIVFKKYSSFSNFEEIVPLLKSYGADDLLLCMYETLFQQAQEGAA